MRNTKIYKLIPVILCLLQIASGLYAQQSKAQYATEEEIKSDILLAPCEDKERLEAVKKLFIKSGAKNADLKIENYKDVENLIITKKGKTDDKIIIGAHYDKTSNGCGVIDNWTGIVILANVYRTIKDLNTEKTIIFVAFGKEELGLAGSKAMAKAIPKVERTNYCAMINFDSFGFAFPQSLTNVSSKSLTKFAEELSKKMELPFSGAAIELASADSESFRTKDIPAITLHGLSNNWRDYLHTANDKIENLNSQSVYIGYRYAFAMLAGINEKPCEYFRK